MYFDTSGLELSVEALAGFGLPYLLAAGIANWLTLSVADKGEYPKHRQLLLLPLPLGTTGLSLFFRPLLMEALLLVLWLPAYFLLAPHILIYPRAGLMHIPDWGPLAAGPYSQLPPVWVPLSLAGLALFIMYFQLLGVEANAGGKWSRRVMTWLVPLLLLLMFGLPYALAGVAPDLPRWMAEEIVGPSMDFLFEIFLTPWGPLVTHIPALLLGFIGWRMYVARRDHTAVPRLSFW
jgi:hypothetical protein